MQGHCAVWGPLLDPNLQPLLPGQLPFSQHPAHLSLHCGAIRLCIQLPVADWKWKWPKQDLHPFLSVSEMLDAGNLGRCGGSIKLYRTPFSVYAMPSSTLASRLKVTSLLKMAAGPSAIVFTFQVGEGSEGVGHPRVTPAPALIRWPL